MTCCSWLFTSLKYSWFAPVMMPEVILVFALNNLVRIRWQPPRMLFV